jgi:DNA-binding NarL/FixJ family response regulator
VTTSEGQTIVRSRVDGVIGWVIVDRLEPSDLPRFRRQTLEVLAAHVRNPAVQTIAISEFHRPVFNATADEQVLGLCQEATELLSMSGKKLVVHVDCGSQTRSVAAPNTSPAYIEPLTGREGQVLAMACEGLSAREIGAQLNISERTVETHISHGYRKLGINSRIDLIRRSAEFGFLTAPVAARRELLGHF